GRRPAAMTNGQVEGSTVDGTDDLADLLIHHGPGDVRIPHGRPDTHGLTCRDERREELSQEVHRVLGLSGSRLGSLGACGDLSASLEDELAPGGEIVLHAADGDSGRLSDGTE